MMAAPITKTLIELLGRDGYLRLIEAHGGTRLYVPNSTVHSRLHDEIGEDTANALSDFCGGNYLKVPLDRAFRARHYRSAGFSNARIARKLGITESGVERLFNRARKADPRQLDLLS